jgi:cobalt-zinc-cadmium efflux system protein
MSHSHSHHDHTHDHPPEDDHGHHHHHHHHHGPANYNRAFAIGLALNLGFVAIEVFYGLIANSVALLADAGHNLSDVLGLVLAWVASILSRRQPSGRYTYGWRRSSILAAFLNALILMLVTGGIAWESLQRLYRPVEVQGQIVMIVAIIGIAINTATALMFMSGRKRDINIRAAFLHMAADALVSLGVVFAGLGILLTGWTWLDPVFSLGISLVIVFNTWEVLRESFNLAVDAVPQGIDARAVRSYLTERPGVTQVHDLHIWGMSTTETALTAHLVMPDGHPGDAFLIEVCQELQGYFGIGHSTLQIEVQEFGCSCTLMPDQRG